MAVKTPFAENNRGDDYNNNIYTAEKMKFFINDFFSKCGQIHGKLRIRLLSLKILLMENFILCVTSS